MVHRARQGLRRSAHRVHQPPARAAQRAGRRVAAEGGHGAARSRRLPGRPARLGQHGGGRSAERLHRLDECIAQYDRHIQAIAREDERAKQLMRLSGVGPTAATAVLAMIGNGHDAAKNARMSWAMLARGEDFKLPA